jgi:hypothetical protein
LLDVPRMNVVSETTASISVEFFSLFLFIDDYWLYFGAVCVGSRPFVCSQWY